MKCTFTEKETTEKEEGTILSQNRDAGVEVKEGVSRDDAKKMGGIAIEQFSDAERAFYDFQVLIKNEKNKEQFPIIGYRHHGKENISWTKDR